MSPDRPVRRLLAVVLATLVALVGAALAVGLWTSAEHGAGGPQATPPWEGADEVGESHAPGWSPPAGYVAVHPVVMGSGSGTGITVTEPDVTLVNPVTSDLETGIVTTAPNTRIVYDPNAPGADAVHFSRERSAFLAEQGADGFALLSLTRDGYDGLKFVDCYRPVTVRAGSGWRVSGIVSTHPDTISWAPDAEHAPDHGHSIVGIKAIVDYPLLDPGQRFVDDVQIDHNTLSDIGEEYISVDANGNVGAGQDSVVQDTATVTAVDPVQGTITVGDLSPGLAPLEEATASFVGGAATGRYLRISAVSGTTFTLTGMPGDPADPRPVLERVRPGDAVSLGGAYSRVRIHDNVLHTEGGYIGIQSHGATYRMEIRDNVVDGDTELVYPPDFHLRPGARQSIALQSLLDIPGGPGVGDEVGLASFASVTGNRVSHDISFATRGEGDVSGIPVYAAGNSSTRGDPGYTSGAYVPLRRDPNPHGGAPYRRGGL